MHKQNEKSIHIKITFNNLILILPLFSVSDQFHTPEISNNKL